MLVENIDTRLEKCEVGRGKQEWAGDRCRRTGKGNRCGRGEEGGWRGKEAGQERDEVWRPGRVRRRDEATAGDCELGLRNP